MPRPDDNPPQPQVGIFWFLPDHRVLFDCTPLDRAEKYGRFLIHSPSHVDVWERWGKEGKLRSHLEYDQVPRGRAAWDWVAERGSMLADRRLATNIVGVLPRDFTLPWGSLEIYLPLGVQANSPRMTDRGDHPNLRVTAKLRPGITLAEARTEMSGIMQRLARAWPEMNKDEITVLSPFMDQFVGDARRNLLLLLGATALVLLLACANVASGNSISAPLSVPGGRDFSGRRLRRIFRRVFWVASAASAWPR